MDQHENKSACQCVHQKKNFARHFLEARGGALEKWSLTPLDNRAGWRAAVFMRELLPVSRVSDLHLLQRFRNGAALSSVIPTNYTTILIKYELRAPDVTTLLVHCKIQRYSNDWTSFRSFEFN